MITEIEVDSPASEDEHETSQLQPKRSPRAPPELLYTVESPNGRISDSFDSMDYDSYQAFVLGMDAVDHNEDSHQDGSKPMDRRFRRQVSWIHAPFYRSHSSWLAKPQIQLRTQRRNRSRDRCIEKALQALDAEDWDNMQDFLNPWGWQQVTLVHLAAYRGNVEMLSRAIGLCACKSTLFAVRDSDKNMGPLLTTDKFGRIALHYAASEGHSNVVSWILERDGRKSPTYLQAQLSLEDVFSRTPLHDAVEGLHASVVKLLIDAGAAVNVPNKKGVPPYLSAKTDLIADDPDKLSRYENIVDSFVTAGVNVNFSHPETGWTMLHHAVSRGSMRASRVLLQHGADPSRKSIEVKAITPMHIATANGNHELLGILLQYLPPSSIDTRNGDGLSPLQMAASKGNIKCAGALVDKGGNLARAYPNSNRTVINDLLVTVDKRNIVTFFMTLLDTKIHSSRDAQDSAVLDYRVLMPEGERQMAVVSVLMNSMKLKELQTILRHPLLRTYIRKKWSHFSKVFCSLLIVYTLFIISLSSYALVYMERYTGQYDCWIKCICKKGTTECDCINDPYCIPSCYYTCGGECHDTCDVACEAKCYSSNIEWRQWLMLFFACILFCYNLMHFLKNPKWYLKHYEDCLSFVPLVISVVVIGYDRYNEGKPNLWVTEALSVAFSSAGLHMILFFGRFSVWGHYAHLLSMILKHVLKILFFGFFIIAGFGLSFHILFYRAEPDSDKPWETIWKTLIMMSGQHEYKILFSDTNLTPFESDTEPETVNKIDFARIVLSIFGISTSIALTNLMIGLAVDDVQKLKTEGRIGRLLKQAEFITHSEWMTKNLIFANACVPNCLRKWVGPTDIDVEEIIPRHKRRPRYISKKLWRDIFTLCKQNEQREQERQIMESRSDDKDNSIATLQLALAAIQSAQKSILGELQLQSSQIQQLTLNRIADTQIEVVDRSEDSESSIDLNEK